MDEADRARVSVDAQFYRRCERCGFEERYRPERADDAPGRKPKKKGQHTRNAAARCLGCGKRAGRRVVRHLLRDRGRCLDCTTPFEILGGPWAVSRCAACGSQRLDIRESAIEPPFPPRFGERDSPASFPSRLSEKAHIWGADGRADANRLKAESDMWRVMPNAHAVIYGLFLFAGRLRNFCVYEEDEGPYLVINIEANLAQAYFRSSGWTPTARRALGLFDIMIDLARDAHDRALAQHSFAMAAFSLFEKFPSLAFDSEAFDWPGLREAAIERAEAAERIFREFAARDNRAAAFQLGRIRWLLGDLVRVGSRNDEDRRRAIGYFDQALADEKLARQLGFALRVSRGAALAALDEPGKDDVSRAIEDLSAALESGGSDQAYANRWRAGQALSRFLLKLGMWKQALPVFQRTASLGWQQFQALGDELQMVSQSEELASAFEGLASLYVGLGWCDEALALIEITRCSSVRLHTMDAAERARFVKTHTGKLLESLFPARLKDAGVPNIFSGTPSAQHIDDILEELAIGTDVLAVLNAHPGTGTGLLTLFEDQNSITALLCTSAIGPEQPGKAAWKVERAQWKLSPMQIAALKDQRHLDPGPFREHLIERLSREGGQSLLEPVLGLLRDGGVSRLFVSLPGSLTGLPLEAFGDAQHRPLLLGLGIAVGYLPSIRLGSDLLDHQRERLGASVPARPRSVLFIGYGGEDLDADHAEYEGVAAVCGSDLVYVPGVEATKQRVLEALRGEHDIIHIQAHGTFDAESPLHSALHFVPNLDDDRRRITAFDLLNEVRFACAPLVVLSACSSAVTSGWRTGTYHGLLGSLLRVGAVGLIGSRWPVGDAWAPRFMTRLHRALRDPDALPERVLHDVAGGLRAEGEPREVWAAFGYIGAS
jgi:CHAT domain-containing protein